MELFLLTTGTKMTHVPFKGAAPAVQELVSGRLDTMFSDLGSGGPQVRGGKLKGLAVAHATRMAQFPNVPTVAESGYPGFDAFAWSGVVAPAGTPREIVQRLNAEMAKAWNDPSVQQKLGDVGFEAMPGPPEALPPFMRDEQAKWRKVIEAAQIKVE
jgi:tripartite-type tricarboxylate transporter receptor subunit TctC